MTDWLRRVANKVRPTSRSLDPEYDSRLGAERRIFDACLDTNALPEIFDYWSNTYVRPMLEEFGVSNPQEFFAKYLLESAHRGQGERTFVSLGAGNCDIEITVAELIRDAGLSDFTIECVDINETMLARGRELAQERGMAPHITTAVGDLNEWRPSREYAGVMVNQALHHVVRLEKLLDSVRTAIAPDRYFVVSDMIGRNGHMRWPEALTAVHHFWKELPPSYRYHNQLQRQEEIYENWDCSTEGFEGVRSQDILPLMLERLAFYVFVPFANVIDVFVDRGFGPNFDATSARDRELIDRIHAFDEAGLSAGRLTPTHLIAVATAGDPPDRIYSRGLEPAACVRRP